MEQTNCRDVVVVRIPSGGVEAMEAVRLETIRAIRSGVWVIPSSYSWTVEQLPALADVEILPAKDLKQGKIDAVVVGCDRMAANGDAFRPEPNGDA